jgi:hypothetical protein
MPKIRRTMKPLKDYEDAFASDLDQLATWRTRRHKPGTTGARCAAKLAHTTTLAAEGWVKQRLAGSPEELRSRLMDAALASGLRHATAESVIKRTWDKAAGKAEQERRDSFRAYSLEELCAEYELRDALAWALRFFEQEVLESDQPLEVTRSDLEMYATCRRLLGRPL